MNKQTKYWIIGIIAVGIILLIWLGISGSRSSKGGNSPDAGVTESSPAAGLGNSTAEDPHAGMDHGQSTSSDQATASYLKEQDTIMANMMKDMEDIPTTGSAAIDYLNGMIPHHESAVAMAESYLKHGGTEPDLVALAGDVIEVQTKEIEQMQAMVKDLEENEAKNNDMEAAYLEEYQKLFAAHHESHMSEAAESVDEAFAEGMILHHQMAADMSKIILEYTDQKDVKELAQNIIDVQEQEIDQMQDILKKLSH